MERRPNLGAIVNHYTELEEEQDVGHLDLRHRKEQESNAVGDVEDRKVN